MASSGRDISFKKYIVALAVTALIIGVLAVLKLVFPRLLLVVSPRQP